MLLLLVAFFVAPSFTVSQNENNELIEADPSTLPNLVKVVHFLKKIETYNRANKFQTPDCCT
jgi:hypothetical protein